MTTDNRQDLILDEQDAELTTVEQDGLKMIDASGHELPPDFMAAVLKAMIQAGLAIKDDTGSLRWDPTQMTDGQLGALDITFEDGDAVASLVSPEELAAIRARYGEDTH